MKVVEKKRCSMKIVKKLCKKISSHIGFSYILMDSVGQEKNEKARFLRPLWTVSDDTGLCGGGDAGI
jgi:hypothetical protein